MVDQRRFLRELPGWLLRGAACALPSAWFGLVAFGFGVAGVAGILIGFVLVVASFAAACSRLAPEGPAWGRALRIAAWIRAGLSIGPGLYLDMLTGGLCMGLFGGKVSQAGLSEFAKVLALTLAQGGLISLEVFLIASVLLLTRLVSR